MSSIKDGCFATVCYLSSAKVKKTLRGVDADAFGSDLDSNRTDGDDEYYDTLKQYQSGSIKKYNNLIKENKNMAKKQLIRITENDLHNIIKESVKKILKEENYDEKSAKKYWDYLGQRPNPEIGERSKFNNAEIYVDGIDDTLFDDWCEMCDKLSKYNDPGEVLDKLIQTNPIFKKWYEGNRKKREIEASWNAFDERKKDMNDLYDAEKHSLDQMHYPGDFANDDKEVYGKRYTAWPVGTTSHNYKKK